jgi:hypothetical protein
MPKQKGITWQRFNFFHIIYPIGICCNKPMTALPFAKLLRFSPKEGALPLEFKLLTKFISNIT